MIPVRPFDTNFGCKIQLTNPTGEDEGEGEGEGEGSSDTANGKGRKCIFSLIYLRNATEY
jgi:hypothetical protein